ncbi:hypothetical protein A6D96_02245 [Vibrio cyclitrophicus]|nr:hypothetical protein A6D96_02245 [Vibrio cyclitrophicus]
MVAFQLMSSVGLFSDAINKFIYPYQMNMLNEKSSLSYNSIVRLIYVWILVLGVSTIVSVWIFSFIVLEFLDYRYQVVTEIIPWLALGQFFNGIYLILLNNIYFSSETRSLSYTTIMVGVFHIALMYVFTLNFGLVGAGMAFSISMLFRMISVFYISSKVVNLPWNVFKR